MSDTITYTINGETITFRYPMLTVTQIPIIAGRGDFTASVKKVYGIRSVVFAEVPSQTLDEAISWMQQILSTPGGILQINYSDWETELNIDPATYPDLKGGPHPRLVEITKIYGSRSAMVHWEVEVELFPTPAGYSGAIADWVDFVYTINTTINKDFYATRTIGGLLKLNKAFTSREGFSADSFRTTISNYFRVPDSSRGYWQRESQMFNVNEDDTILRFTLIDRQVYSWLPQYITSGDLKVATATSRTDAAGVTSTLTLSGFLQSTDYAPRQLVHGAILDILNMFANRVLYTMKQETSVGTGGQFWVRERRFAFVHHWRSNRVDFDLNWEIKGQFAGGLIFNIEYTTALVLQWLAELTVEKGIQPAEDEESGTSPYGTSMVAGATGRDYISSPLEINFSEKIAASRSPGYWDIPEYGVREDKSQSGSEEQRTQTAESSDNISFHQNFTYKINTGVRSLPLLVSGYNDAFQQVHNPRTFLLITGEAERWDAPPLIPRPPYTLAANSFGGADAQDTTDPYAMLLSSEVVAKEPTGDGKYRITWQHVLQIQNLDVGSNLDSAGVLLRWPWTPNFPGKTWKKDSLRSWDEWTFPQ